MWEQHEEQAQHHPNQPTQMSFPISSLAERNLPSRVQHLLPQRTLCLTSSLHPHQQILAVQYLKEPKTRP